MLRLDLSLGRNPTVQIREVPRPSAFSRRPTTTRSRNPTVQIREVPRGPDRPDYVLVEKSQSHRTDQGSSKGAHGDGTPPEGVKSRNPTVQIREVPSRPSAVSSRPSSRPSQSHRTDQGSSKENLIDAVARAWTTGRNPTVQIREVPRYSTAALFGSCGSVSRNPTVQIREVPRRTRSTSPMRTKRAVAIPPYRSGKFQGEG